MNCLRRAVLRRMMRAPRWGAPEVLRDYEAPDPARSIDWHATARAGTVKARDRARDRPIAWMAIVDESPSMFVGRRRPLFEAACRAARAWRAAAAGDDRWIEPTPARCSFREALQTAFSRIDGPTALLVVSDFYDLAHGDGPLLEKLARKAHCAALVARDPWSAYFPVRGYVRVIDAENASLRELVIGGRNAASFRRACRYRLSKVMRRLAVSGWLATDFGEEAGAADLLALYGLR